MAAPYGLTFQVIVDGRDVTDHIDAISCSATDPGGFEIAQLNFPRADSLRKNAEVMIRAGSHPLWHGRVAEDQDDAKFGKATRGGGCEGYQAKLRDATLRQIFIDRDLSHWGPASVQQKINWIGASTDEEDGAVLADQSTAGAPALVTQLTGAWGRQHASELWYDAQGLAIGALYYPWKVNALINSADGNWSWNAGLSTDDITGSIDITASLRAAGPGSGTLLATAANRRFAFLRLVYGVAAGTADQVYQVIWTCPAIYGTHGLPLRGSGSALVAPGLWPSDIARYALAQCSGIVPGVIIDSSGYVSQHAAYLEATPGDKIVDDQANLMGWHWGVWEPNGLFSTAPRMDFRPPPADATAIVSRPECEEFNITTRLGDLYDTAIVSYNDGAGRTRTVTVTLPNPVLAEAGLSGRSLPLSMGVSTAAGAQTFGQNALALAQVAERGAGHAALPSSVRLPGGGHLPACLLRPGLDRLRVQDLPNAGPVTLTDTRRRDVFRLKRIETNWAKGGAPSSQCELDGGMNLQDVELARLQVAATIGGF